MNTWHQYRISPAGYMCIYIRPSAGNNENQTHIRATSGDLYMKNGRSPCISTPRPNDHTLYYDQSDRENIKTKTYDQAPRQHWACDISARAHIERVNNCRNIHGGCGLTAYKFDAAVPYKQSIATKPKAGGPASS